MTATRYGRIKKLMDHILAVEPQYIDIFGNTMPGMPGRTAATSGAANAAADVVNDMRQVAIEFAKLYVEPTATEDAKLELAASEIEAKLTVCVTLGVLSEEQANKLADEINDALEARYDEKAK